MGDNKEADYQKSYYEKNREKILERRRQKYIEDAEYRRKARARDLRNYWLRPRGSVAKDKEVTGLEFEEIEPRGRIEVKVENPEDTRNGLTVEVALYGTPEIGQMLDRDQQTIRKWLTAGVIPEPALRGEALPEGHALRRGRSQRLYTEDEARTIYACREHLARPFLRIKDSLFAQCVREELGKLVNGLTTKKRKR
jgi:hypothetical protein